MQRIFTRTQAATVLGCSSEYLRTLSKTHKLYDPVNVHGGRALYHIGQITLIEGVFLGKFNEKAAFEAWQDAWEQVGELKRDTIDTQRRVRNG